MKRKSVSTMALIFGLVVLAVHVATPDASQAGTKQFKIGVMGPMTGDQARWGLDLLHSVEVAAEEVNAKGGILGAKVVVTGEDDQHNPKLGEAVAQKFVDDKEVMGVVGPYNSAVVLAITPIFEKASVVHMGASFSNPKITEQGFKTVFRVNSRDDRQGPAGAEYVLKTLKAKKIAVLDDQTTFGKGVADEFVKKAEAEGVKPMRSVIKAGTRISAPSWDRPQGHASHLLRRLRARGRLWSANSRSRGKGGLPDPDGLFGARGLHQPQGRRGRGSVVTALAAPPRVSRRPRSSSRSTRPSTGPSARIP
jgi:branched-chain amino acid transport system substrate-binding protein